MPMQRLVKCALVGDEEALNIFDIGDQEIVPRIKAVSFDSLSADFKRASLVNLAAKQVNLNTLERISRKLLLYISSLLKVKYPKKSLGTDAT